MKSNTLQRLDCNPKTLRESMLYLVLSMFMSSWWALSYKVALRKGCDSSGVTTAACGAAAAAGVLWAALSPSFSLNLPAALIGAAGGLALFMAIEAYFVVVRGGAQLGLSWAVLMLSMLIPTSLSAFLWHETPTPLQAVGLLLAMVSIWLLGRTDPGAGRLAGGQWKKLAVAFMLSGMVGTSLKMLPGLGLEKFKLTHMVSFYSAAFLPALLRNCTRGTWPGRKELAVGTAMGLAGMGGVFFMLLALETIPGTVAFPAKTCGTVLLTVAAAHLMWHEKLKGRELPALACTLLAILLISI